MTVRKRETMVRLYAVTLTVQTVIAAKSEKEACVAAEKELCDSAVGQWDVSVDEHITCSAELPIGWKSSELAFGPESGNTSIREHLRKKVRKP
jgi:hypothetical protein